jgi:hypothetical protein
MSVMIIESIESFLADRTVRDVSASEPQAKLFREYQAYCMFADVYPVTLREFGQYLRFTDRRQIRGFGGRAHHQGLRFTATFNPY